MEEEKKVIIKLKREPLKSEREEIKAKRKRKFLVFLLSFMLVVCGTVVGVGVSYFLFEKHASNENTVYNEVKNIMKKVWLYKNNYNNLDNTLDEKALYGMTTFSEDPYTSYMSKEENVTFISSINMDYVGIGVQYYNFKGEALVTRVFKDSPAQKAGIEVGDILVEVDGKSLEGLETEEIKNLVIGNEGTVVNITIRRNNELITLPTTRGSVDSTVYLVEDGDDIILYIMSFGENTAKECAKYLEEYKNRDSIIIDVRDNSGGLQTSVQEVAGLFLGDGVTYMKQEYADGSVIEDKTKSDSCFENFKRIAILTNNSTASAAEVFAICMKEQHKNVYLVGEKTYGKGVVQGRYTLSDGSTIKVTSSKWLSPNGLSIDKIGIAPDYEVKLNDLFYLTVPKMEDNETYEFDSVDSKILICEKALQYLDYDCKRNDGYFDDNFKDILNKYKADNSMKEDGLLDKKTYDLILDEVSFTYSTNLSKDPQLAKAKEVIK